MGIIRKGVLSSSRYTGGTIKDSGPGKRRKGGSRGRGGKERGRNRRGKEQENEERKTGKSRKNGEPRGRYSKKRLYHASVMYLKKP